jgi:peptide-methionine (S)-S-oxide reductase
LSSTNAEITTLAGGCFWCLEAVFEKLRGVNTVVSGYTGGNVPNPSYEQVCAGTTGHAEAVQVHFEPDIISYRQLLEIFFAFHDPTTLNRQGPDVGTQYRSTIIYHDLEQKEIAENVVRRLEAEGIWQDLVLTQLVPLDKFYPAEAYHQGYFRRNSDTGYCTVIIAPKMVKLRESYNAMLK